MTVTNTLTFVTAIQTCSDLTEPWYVSTCSTSDKHVIIVPYAFANALCRGKHTQVRATAASLPLINHGLHTDRPTQPTVARRCAHYLSRARMKS